MEKATMKDATRDEEPLDRTRLYIGGKWVASEGQNRIEVVNPATEQTIAFVAAGTASDVDLAVHAARTAFAGWSVLSGAERADYLLKTSEALACLLYTSRCV